MAGTSSSRRGRSLALLRTAAFGGYSAAALAAYELHRRAVAPEDVSPLKARYKRRIAGDLLTLLGVEATIVGERFALDRPRLVVSNHRTALDIGLLLGHFAGSMLSRADVSAWPVLGRLATHGETIFVDRDDKASGAKAIRQIRRALIDGRTVVAFPEGTTLEGDDVRPFQGGAFAATRRLSVDIVPVGLAYDEGVEWTSGGFMSHVGGLAARRQTRVVGVVGKPFAANGTSSELAARSHDLVQGLVVEARALYRARYG
jgi:1-acyl-sn-glycerol-3-phosphate acyltransferase